ncbi:DUF1987 domain-containing protein [Azospirillum halopraeferens]|uniref:DUF1987 domain-containing protein n=1 Tax=Azospirillum halopraeferens TaxID=34010 RepID=UPI0004099926|nr:DUF1987 domain-containing protein [Azospirillum halopraeferens]
MDALRIDATRRTPLVDFDFPAGVLRLAGESYPDDSASFFGPVLTALREWLAASDVPVRLDVELVYFNSSSAKALMNMFQALETAAAGGRPVRVIWRCDEDDDAMREFAEDFSEDLDHVEFTVAERLDAAGSGRDDAA